ncbi:MAG: tRNA uridine-5-carboxymethylaminomethyl(34) synthesis enzyme MnmG [Nitrospinae bacterium]|nr:tRNA uridine-5-carboxymethylaminomethyl(34) synthesis enzyme MnmG [Nitrospinota bacterium]
MRNSNAHFDVIVIGAGHAGCETALAAARMGAKTLLLTINIDQVAAMSCNPAIGGLAKGHLVREIDALGGEMGLAIDDTGIQFRTLNRSKGPAVQAYRAQADRRLYRERMRVILEQTPGLSIRQGMVTSIECAGDKVTGVRTAIGQRFDGAAVVLASGTFLNGLIHIGESKIPAGRAGDPAAVGISKSLIEQGFIVGRLKTGTCPRLDRSTIDYSRCEEQPGDPDPRPFSFWSKGIVQPQVSCWITWTNEETRRVIGESLHRSPLFTGQIEGVGPRYCPSIEDKVKRFPEKSSHQIFLEPEGLTTKEIYPNGLSTSLPIDVQERFLQTIPGLERVEIMRPGYAIEYDYCPPTQLYPTLMTKPVAGLFFAGQINGTSGYEEAAAQGLVAGINAARYSMGEEMVIFPRQESYIGVMIDDLVTKGTEEPYRMFTSRAEFRLLLRQDNADRRLCDLGHQVGLLPDDRYERYRRKWERIEEGIDSLDRIRLSPKDERIDPAMIGGPMPGDGATLKELLRRPEVTLDLLPGFERGDLTVDEREQIEIVVKYEGYIDRQERLLKKTAAAEHRAIPPGIDYRQVAGLSTEIVEKLGRIRPASLGQAGRIAGVTPAAIAMLHIHLERASRTKGEPPSAD